MRNPVRPSSCVTPAGTSNELDVQNEWEENTHTHNPLDAYLYGILSVAHRKSKSKSRPDQLVDSLLYSL